MNYRRAGFCAVTTVVGMMAVVTTSRCGSTPPIDADAGDSSADVLNDILTDAATSVDGPVSLKGAIQKGPFILGSRVTLSAIDTFGSPTGTVFTTQTTSDLGDFSVNFSYRGSVDIAAQGFYYDEVSGGLSGAALTLRALYNVADGGAQSAYVNVLTHLAHDRARSIIADGGTLNAAEAKAEQELVVAFGVGGAGFTPTFTGVNLDELGTSDAANAYLFALSAVLVQMAREQAGGGSVDAKLQALLNTFASNLATGTSFGPADAGIIEELRAAERDLDVDLAMDLFQYRLQAVGSSATPADLNLAVDSDGDGYRNSIDTCPLVANPTQSIIPVDAICKATRHTTFVSPTTTGACLLAGDFENKGHVGLLTSCDQTAATLYSGDGAGRFSAPLAVSMPAADAGLYFYPEKAIDLDGDGKLDLLSIGGWSPGDGAGHFGSISSFPDLLRTLDGGAPPTAPYYAGIVIGDFNGDTLPDVVRIVFPSNDPEQPALGLAVSLGTSKGHFAAPTLTSLPSSLASNYSAEVFMGDMNNDSKADLVVVWQLDGTASYAALTLLGDGAGHFSAATPVAFDSGAVLGGGGAIVDVDGDGKLDVAAWYPSCGGVCFEVAFGDGAGGFSSVVGTPNFVESVTVADVNNDGKTDIVAIFFDDPTYYLGVALSTGKSFATPQHLRTNAIDAISASVYGSPTIGDFNGDGTLDIALVTPDFAGTWSIQAVLKNYLQ